MVIKRTLVHIGTIVAAVAMLVPVGSAATATAATPVPVNSVDHTVLVQTAQADEYGTESFSDCTNILENLGYEITPVRL
jgi:hypothetical protein